jgi:hypothetical protein
MTRTDTEMREVVHRGIVPAIPSGPVPSAV